MTKLYQHYQFGVLSCHAICILDQSLELVVLSESDDLQHSAELGENLGKEDSTIREVIITIHLSILLIKKYTGG